MNAVRSSVTERASTRGSGRSAVSSTLQLSALALLTACSHPAAVTGVDGSPTTPPAATDAATIDSAGKPRFISDNPDGTFTIQKQPAKAGPQDTRDSGLVIPPQVVVPLTSTPEAKRRN
jgi:hypothetical protein